MLDMDDNAIQQPKRRNYIILKIYSFRTAMFQKVMCCLPQVTRK